MKFTTRLWGKINPIYLQIINHPFNTELSQGILNQERFTFYIQQDVNYLVQFSKTLALIAGRSQTSRMIHQFLNLSLNALVYERDLLTDFLKESHHQTSSINHSPACMAYSRYLLATAATSSIEEAAAAILPCFWIYREIGQQMRLNMSKNNPFEKWIYYYANDAFSCEVEQAISIVDELANQASQHLLSLMTQAFEHSALLEWYFFNDAYNLVAIHTKK